MLRIYSTEGLHMRTFAKKRPYSEFNFWTSIPFFHSLETWTPQMRLSSTPLEPEVLHLASLALSSHFDTFLAITDLLIGRRHGGAEEAKGLGCIRLGRRVHSSAQQVQSSNAWEMHKLSFLQDQLVDGSRGLRDQGNPTPLWLQDSCGSESS